MSKVGQTLSVNTDNPSRSRPMELQPLERRALMSAVPLGITTAITPLGTELRISGTSRDDIIALKRTPTRLLVTTGTGWRAAFAGSYCDVRIDGGAGNDQITVDKSIATNTVLLGGSGNDTIVDGGSGTDRIYSGDGINRITTGRGSDTIVTLGGTADTIHAGTGSNTFWADPNDVIKNITPAEKAAGAVHRVADFMPVRTQVNGIWNTTPVSKRLGVQSIAEPAIAPEVSGFTNFSSDPLFAADGPKEDDVHQGAVGDCYFLAPLASLAKLNPRLLQQSIVDLGDGTYAVQFFGTDGTRSYVRVDGNLPTAGDHSLAYADLGHQNSTWVALMEKAWTYFRSNSGSYESIDTGFMSEAYNALGLSNNSTIWQAPSSSVLFGELQSALSAGKSVIYSTDHDQANLIGSHAYTVDHLTYDSTGTTITGLVLRNPWGFDGAGSDGADDGYVTVTPSAALQDFAYVTVATPTWT